MPCTSRATEQLVEVLDQTYSLPVLDRSAFSCSYTAQRFEYAAELNYDATGLILDYPELAERAVDTHGVPR
ncbi:hypothetical protein [Rhodococcus sp. 077-4]|uniref:hypothetical protein n=1 Tax=Rhodococcus sp. 077-4 TaxID=2789271 RepID=UPI0039F6283D